MPSWAPLGRPEDLAQALRAAGFHDVAVHRIVHHFDVPDPVAFFRELPTWTPLLRPLFASLRAEQLDAAASAFRDVIGEHATRDGVPHAALIGMAS